MCCAAESQQTIILPLVSYLSCGAISLPVLQASSGAASQQRKRRLGSGSDDGSAGEESDRRQQAAAQPPTAKRAAAAASSGGPARQQPAAAAAAEPVIPAPMSIEEIRKVRGCARFAVCLALLVCLPGVGCMTIQRHLNCWCAVPELCQVAALALAQKKFAPLTSGGGKPGAAAPAQPSGAASRVRARTCRSAQSIWLQCSLCCTCAFNT